MANKRETFVHVRTGEKVTVSSPGDKNLLRGRGFVTEKQAKKRAEKQAKPTAKEQAPAKQTQASATAKK